MTANSGAGTNLTLLGANACHKRMTVIVKMPIWAASVWFLRVPETSARAVTASFCALRALRTWPSLSSSPAMRDLSIASEQAAMMRSDRSPFPLRRSKSFRR